MVMVCPQCNWSSPTDTRCPECQVPLRPRGSASRRGPAQPAWHQTAQGRTVLTALIAAGLSYGNLLLANVLLRQGYPGHEVDPIAGYAVFAACQALAVLVTGLVAGAGNRQPVGAGATMGLMSGLLILTGLLGGILRPLTRTFVPDALTAGGAFNPTVFYGVPALHVVCGALGGWLGQCVWQPPPVISMAILRAAGPSVTLAAAPAARGWALWSGPVCWLRVVAGTLVAVGGGVFTRTVIEFVLDASDGYFRILTDVQGRVTTGEVFSLSILLGGCVAGATTRNGLKQGLCVGVVAAASLTGFFLTGLLDVSGTALMPVFTAAILGPLGGWFGSELLPHGDTRRRRKTWLDDAPPTAMS
jgi:hypothetical protein